PLRHRTGNQTVQGELVRFGELVGTQPHPTVAAACGGHGQAVWQRDGQCEPVVVVGVFSDEVDPPRHGPHPLSRAAEGLPELRGQVAHGATCLPERARTNAQASATILSRPREGCQRSSSRARSLAATSTAGSPERRGPSTVGTGCPVTRRTADNTWRTV